MTSPRYALGLDFGTNSCRSLLVDLSDGSEMGTSIFSYPSGQHGILTTTDDPHLARQNPQDYLDGTAAIVRGALAQAREAVASFDPAQVIGLGIDTTGSTIIPVNREGTALGLLPEFKNNLNAQVWLWKDHTAHAEAKAITEKAAALRPEYLAKCGGIYSSEWFWSKIWRLQKADPAVFAAAYSFVEHCDWLPAVLTGQTDPLTLPRGVCSAGHKAMFHPAWGGLPDKEFLAELSPALADLRDRLFETTHPAGHRAGGLSREWAEKLGLREGMAVSVGAFDAHLGAVGAGIRPGTMVKILGTSTCDLMVHPSDEPLADIPGVCGIVDGSVTPGFYGIEAGQSAVGDIFLWFVHHLVPNSYGATAEEKFQRLEAELSRQKPGASGLLALDWNNGNRTVLVDTRLTGLLLGQTLHTQAHEIYRALIEATAFGALTIINRIESHGVPVREVVTTGGLAVKNRALMQIYADVLGRPIKISRSDQTCALGAAIAGAVAAGAATGGFDDFASAQALLCATREEVYQPRAANMAVYGELFNLYSQLHDAFGVSGRNIELSTVMKTLLEIRDQARGQSSQLAES